MRRLAKHRDVLIIAASIAGSSMVMLGESVVSLALPSIGKTLQVPFASLQWVVDGYDLTLSAFILLGGSLGDLFGLRRVYLWSACAFLLPIRAISGPSTLWGPGQVWKVAPHGGRYLDGPPGFTCYDSMALEAGGNLCVASLVYGGITVVAPDGRFIEFVPLPDPLCTNLCFGGPGLYTAFVTLSGSGRLVSLPWPRPGLRLNID